MAVLSLRAQLLQLAREALSNVAPVDGNEILTVTVQAAGVELVLTSRVGEFATPDNLPDIQRAIIRVCGAVPQNSKQIAARAGYTLGSHVRSAITELVRQGILTRTADGYRLANCRDTRDDTPVG